MSSLRRFLRDHRTFALLLVLLALAVKAVMPAGFMVGVEGKVITVSVCADASGAHVERQVTVPSQPTAEQKAAQHAKSEVCPFAALAMSGTAGADAYVLALALAFILAIGLAPLTAPSLLQRAYLRPPLRGPPAIV